MQMIFKSCDGAAACNARRGSLWGLGLTLMLLVFPSAGCAVFGLTDDQLAKMGAEQAPLFEEQSGGAYPDQAIQDYVTQLGRELVAVSEVAHIDFQFTVLDDDGINAFALPGGYVYITRGLLAQMDNEAQLVGVLGHEIGHIHARHTAERMEAAITAQVGIAALAIIFTPRAEDDESTQMMKSALIVGSQVTSSLLIQGFSRQDELESDSLGVKYMVRAGYNPYGQVGVMRVLRDMAGSSRSPEFLSTHPYPETRIEALLAQIEKRYPDANDEPGVDSGNYRWHRDRFQREVVSRLAVLPPAGEGSFTPKAVALAEWWHDVNESPPDSIHWHAH